MTKADCPVSIQERHDEDIQKLYDLSLPAWTRETLLVLLGLLFVLYGGLWAYLLTQYPTKDDMKEMRAEIRQDMKEIKEKLDGVSIMAGTRSAAAEKDN
jgi:hypothetical protein